MPFASRREFLIWEKVRDSKDKELGFEGLE